jgi:hypothetical protein
MAALLLVLSLIVLDEFASARPRRRRDRIDMLCCGALHKADIPIAVTNFSETAYVTNRLCA